MNGVSRHQNQVTSFKKLKFLNSQPLKGFQENDLFLEKINKAIPVYSKNSNQLSGLDMYMSRVSFLGNKKGPMEGFLILNFG